MSELMSVLDSVRGHTTKLVYDQVSREVSYRARYLLDNFSAWRLVWDSVHNPISEHIRDAAELERWGDV